MITSYHWKSRFFQSVFPQFSTQNSWKCLHIVIWRDNFCVMFKRHIKYFLGLALIALAVCFTWELFWAVIVLILGTFYRWGFSTGFHDLEAVKKNYHDDVQRIFKWLPILLAVFGCVFWYELVQCSVCAGHLQAEELNLLLPLVAVLGYFWGRIPVTMAEAIIALFGVIKPELNGLPVIKPNDSVVDFALEVPLSPPRFHLA